MDVDGSSVGVKDAAVAIAPLDQCTIRRHDAPRVLGWRFYRTVFYWRIQKKVIKYLNSTKGKKRLLVPAEVLEIITVGLCIIVSKIHFKCESIRIHHFTADRSGNDNIQIFLICQQVRHVLLFISQIELNSAPLLRVTASQTTIRPLRKLFSPRCEHTEL